MSQRGTTAYALRRYSTLLRSANCGKVHKYGTVLYRSTVPVQYSIGFGSRKPSRGWPRSEEGALRATEPLPQMRACELEGVCGAMAHVRQTGVDRQEIYGVIISELVWTA